jgi:negative regulator of flagellin synthesis FlgM
MAVKLTGMELSGATIGSARKPSASQAKTTSSQDAAPQQDATQKGDVSITSTASMLANVQQSLAAQPAVDQNRVDSISNALANGTYQIDPARIASGLIQSERGLTPLPRQEI